MPGGEVKLATGLAFQPHPLLGEPHLQMIAGALLRATSSQDFRSERVETADGDFVDLAWFGESADRPLAILVHGIGGGLKSGYVHAMAAALGHVGIDSVALQLRGAGTEPNRQPIMYHHGNTEDFHSICRALAARFPRRRLCAIGWSMGASIVIKGVGEDGRSSPLSCAVAISAPLQLRECAEHLSVGRARLYQSLMLSQLKGRVRRKFRSMQAPTTIDVPRALAARDFFEFGDALIAPLCGDVDARAYCERVNPGRHLGRVKRPMLIVQAADDPLLGPAVYPTLEVSPQVRIEVSSSGGHVGFVSSGAYGAPTSWLEGRVANFVSSQMQARPAEASDAAKPLWRECNA